MNIYGQHFSAPRPLPIGHDTALKLKRFTRENIRQPKMKTARNISIH